MKCLHAFLDEMDEGMASSSSSPACSGDGGTYVAVLWSGLSRRFGGCYCSTHSRSMDRFPGQTGAQVTARGRVFLCLGHGFPTSSSGVHGPSADGLGASTLCRIWGWASAGPRAWATSTDSPASPATSRPDTSGEENRGGQHRRVLTWMGCPHLTMIYAHRLASMISR